MLPVPLNQALTGLRYVNNDICYPSILVTGRLGGSAGQIRPRPRFIRRPAVAAVQPTTLHSWLPKQVTQRSWSFPGLLPPDEDNPGFKLQARFIKAVYALLHDLIRQPLHAFVPTRPSPSRVPQMSQATRSWPTAPFNGISQGIYKPAYHRAGLDKSRWCHASASSARF